MKSARWQRIEQLYHAALEREAEQRASFLVEACPDDAALRSEVEALLAANEQARGFMPAPALELEPRQLAAETPAPSGVQVGQELSHYKILSRIGAGGMGEVYLAEDTKLGRKVAIKVLPEYLKADELAKKRMLREARAAAKLDHSNICSIYEVSEADALTFIVMQYIEGETLASKIKRDPLGLDAILDITIQVADALSEAHRQGIIHRDIKPQNIMITERNQVKVLDFGIAKLTESSKSAESQLQTKSMLTEMGALIGTLPYMSPEQVKAEDIDARSDVFSLGIVIYEMATRSHPFAAKSATATILMILTSEPLPITHFLADAPSEFQRILSKALCKNRNERYQTARDLMIDARKLKEDISFNARVERSFPPASGSLASAVAENQTASIGASKEFGAHSEQPAHVQMPHQLFASRISRYKWILLAFVLSVIILYGAINYFTYPERSDSVAILPFSYGSTDPQLMAKLDSEYLSDGLTESIINSLSQLPELKVIARSSVFRYKGQDVGKDVDLHSIARELGVQSIMVGRIVQLGDNLTISVELVGIRENRQVWGERYHRKTSDLLAVQKEIAKEISENLRLKLTGEDQKRLAKNYTDDGEAYQQYLKGRYYWNKRTGEGLNKAIEFFEQAVKIDQKYALAYTGLADCYTLLSDFGYIPPTKGYLKAKGYVEEALKLDDNLAEAHTSLASIKAVIYWDWSGAESQYRKAIELNPNYPTAHQWYATHSLLMGNFDQALAEIRKAQQLDPLSLGINKDFGAILLFSGQYPEAREQCRKTLQIDPSFLVMSTYIAQTYEMEQRYDEALAEIKRAHEIAPDDAEITYGLAQAYAYAGKITDARTILNKINQPQKQDQYLPKEMALLYALLGEKEKAINILQEAYKNHHLSVAEIATDPRFAMLRSDARLSDLLRSLGLAQ